MARIAGEEVEQVGRVALHLGERAAARPDRAADRRHVHREAGEDRGQRAARHPGQSHRPAQQRVGDEERHGAEREVNLAGERDRRERRPCERDPRLRAPARALERVQRERQQHRHRRQQMAHGALRDEVRRQREREAAGERPRTVETELAQPEERQSAGAREGQQHEGVPGEHRAEQGVQRPEDEPERPGGEVRARIDLRLEAVRVEPGRRALLQLVPGQPELPDRLEMVARRRLAAGGQPLREEAVIRAPRGGPGGDQPSPDVGGEDEGYKACAAATMASRSGTSASS